MTSPERGHRPLGLALLAAFFVFGTLMASLATLGLLFPGSALEPMWRLNRYAQVGLMELKGWGILLMVIVATACGLAAAGIWARKRWGWTLAVAILVVNLIGDVTSAWLRGDLRTLIGIPIGGALLLYLLSSRIQAQFKRLHE